jgi:hypothetical protein
LGLAAEERSNAFTFSFFLDGLFFGRKVDTKALFATNIFALMLRNLAEHQCKCGALRIMVTQCALQSERLGGGFAGEYIPPVACYLAYRQVHSQNPLQVYLCVLLLQCVGLGSQCALVLV